MEKRYNILRIIAVIYKVIGVLLLGATIIGFVFIVVTALTGGLAASQSATSTSTFGATSPWLGLLVWVPILLGGILSALGTYAFGELVELLIATEENTRATALLLDAIRARNGGQPHQG